MKGISLFFAERRVGLYQEAGRERENANGVDKGGRWMARGESSRALPVGGARPSRPPPLASNPARDSGEQRYAGNYLSCDPAKRKKGMSCTCVGSECLYVYLFFGRALRAVGGFFLFRSVRIRERTAKGAARGAGCFFGPGSN